MPKVSVTDENLPKILNIIDTWKGKMTWGLVIEKVEDKVLSSGETITRQALSSYVEIQDAYTNRLEYLRGLKRDNSPETIYLTYDESSAVIEELKSKVETLEAELQRQKAKNKEYKEIFVRWQYNAARTNMRIDTLDDYIDDEFIRKIEDARKLLSKPLPKVNRKE